MRALNIKVRDTPGQTVPVHNPDKDSLNDILDSDINDKVASTTDTNPCTLKRTISATQPGTFFDIPLPSRLFGEAASDGDKNSSPFGKRSLLPLLLPIIVLKEPSNPFFKLFGNYRKLKKRKPRAALISWGLADLSYITYQSGSQRVFAVSKGNIDSMENSWRNQMQKGSSIVREQKEDIGLDVSQGKLKRESSMIVNFIHDDSDLTLVDNWSV